MIWVFSKCTLQQKYLFIHFLVSVPFHSVPATGGERKSGTKQVTASDERSITHETSMSNQGGSISHNSKRRTSQNSTRLSKSASHLLDSNLEPSTSKTTSDKTLPSASSKTAKATLARSRIKHLKDTNHLNKSFIIPSHSTSKCYNCPFEAGHVCKKVIPLIIGRVESSLKTTGLFSQETYGEPSRIPCECGTVMSHLKCMPAPRITKSGDTLQQNGISTHWVCPKKDCEGKIWHTSEPGTNCSIEKDKINDSVIVCSCGYFSVRHSCQIIINK